MIEMAKDEDSGRVVDWSEGDWKALYEASFKGLSSDTGKLKNFKEKYKEELLKETLAKIRR
jgi:hypothetical protein